MIFILVNHIGYGTKSPKKVIFRCTEGEVIHDFTVVDENDREIYSGQARKDGEVVGWNMRDFYSGDFSSVQTEGRYAVRVQGGKSPYFEVRDYRLKMKLMNAVIYYFKAQRDSGEWMLEDRRLPFAGPREGTVDAHGGWFDATGDYGIHFSHLSHGSFFNPQQVPLSDYIFFKAYENMENTCNEEYSMLKRRDLDEGHFGAAFIMRMRAPSGTFFRSINRQDALAAVRGTRRIGFEYHGSSTQFGPASTADIEQITDENYEVGFRSGGGMAIAALAIAARYYYPSEEYSQKEYIDSATDAYHYLKENNLRYANDGKENLVDEYCALCAVTELYKTTGEVEYLHEARNWMKKIASRAVEVGPGRKYLEVSEGIPYFSACDEGLPAASLLWYAQIEKNELWRGKARSLAEELLRFETEITETGVNPFGYPRMHVLRGGKIHDQFFFPHDTTVAPWWQGDNARIASISAAAALMERQTDDRKLKGLLGKLQQDPLDWILGLNPYDSCMMEGYGRNNINYFFHNRYDFVACQGGIVNGITSGLEDEDSIAYVMEPCPEVDDNWRWAEQWIPHASWFLYAVSLLDE
jgi:hypothetical protein